MAKFTLLGVHRLQTHREAAIMLIPTKYTTLKTGKWSLDANLPYVVTYGAAVATEGFMAPPLVYIFGGYFFEFFQQ